MAFSVFRAQNTRDVVLHLLIILLTATLLILSFFYLYLPYTTHHGQTITVPDLKGMSLDKLEDYLSERDLDYKVADSTFDALQKPLTIYGQDPAAGARVKQGRKIYLYVYAKRAPNVKMPNLINRSLVNAKGELESYGLLIGETKMVPDLQQNSILKQMFNGVLIPEGTTIPKGSKIDLEVGDGLGNQELSMPDLINQPRDEAEAILSGSGLQLGTVTFQKRDGVAEGTVLKQKPSVAAKIRVGEEVDIWVAGEDPTLIPDTDTE